MCGVDRVVDEEGRVWDQIVMDLAYMLRALNMATTSNDILVIGLRYDYMKPMRAFLKCNYSMIHPHHPRRLTPHAFTYQRVLSSRSITPLSGVDDTDDDGEVDLRDLG